jgi:hypothetical protein
LGLLHPVEIDGRLLLCMGQIGGDYGPPSAAQLGFLPHTRSHPVDSGRLVLVDYRPLLIFWLPAGLFCLVAG